MKGLIQKLIGFLLKKSDQLGSQVDNPQKTTDDPMQKKIQALLARKEMMKSALEQAKQQKND